LFHNVEQNTLLDLTPHEWHLVNFSYEGKALQEGDTKMNTEKEITLKGQEINLVTTAIGTVICNILTDKNSKMSHEERMTSYEFWNNLRKTIESR